METTTPTTTTPKALKKFALEALTKALATPYTAGRSSGCGRAYVIVTAGGDKKLVNAVAAAAKTLGVLWLKKAYGTSGNALYIGYDNGTGGPLAKAKAVAEALTSLGVAAYDDAVGD
jgi:hypothetical protein